MTPFSELSIDIETYSSVDLQRASVYRYAEAPDFQVLLFAYSLNEEPVQVIDLTREQLPGEVVALLLDPACIKWAFNAQFERVCLSRFLKLPHGVFLDPKQWRCSQVLALSQGLPRSLAAVGKALGLPEEQQKMKEGKALIQYFCKPCKPTKANGGRTRNLPTDAPDKWATFIRYNRRDVETEMAIRENLVYPLPDIEWAAYAMDQRINDRGIQVDKGLADAAVAIHEDISARLTAEATKLTGLENVRSMQQLKGWLGQEGSLDKKAVSALREGGTLTKEQDRVLAIRQSLGKSSVEKYAAMLNNLNSDGRVRGLFAFYGASRTGRWAGRLVQLQNLPQNHIPDLEAARSIAKAQDGEGLEMLYGDREKVLSELIRTAFVAPKGFTYAVADFSAIEARVIAWLADEKWRQDVFAKGGDIYCASASQMFHVPVEKHGVNGHLRQKGKVAELALGYGGGVGAMKAMGAIEMGLEEEELQPIVNAWRKASPKIVDLWWAVDEAAKEAIQGPGQWSYALPHGLSIRYAGDTLQIKLPSGRLLHYWHPKLREGRFPGSTEIRYMGLETGKWVECSTYGPKLVENIVQATARDCLRDTMARVAEKYPKIVMHVHDEMVVEVPEEGAKAALSDMYACMSKPIEWAPGLVLKGDGYITPFYKKD